jgi:hypothetical protein
VGFDSIPLTQLHSGVNACFNASIKARRWFGATCLPEAVLSCACNNEIVVSRRRKAHLGTSI